MTPKDVEKFLESHKKKLEKQIVADALREEAHALRRKLLSTLKKDTSFMKAMETKLRQLLLDKVPEIVEKQLKNEKIDWWIDND